MRTAMLRNTDSKATVQAPHHRTPKRTENAEKVVELSSKVKQANFRLPLEYMGLIDEFSSKEGITKAAVITRALDCLKASYDAGSGGAPVAAGGAGGASVSELNDLKAKLTQAEARAQQAMQDLDAANSRAAAAEQARAAAEARASEAFASRDAAESRAREVSAELSSAQMKIQTAAATPSIDTTATDAELARLRAQVAQQEQMIAADKLKRDAELAEKAAAIAERDARISSLTEQLGAANAKAELAMKNINVEAVTLGEPAAAADDEQTRALAMLNMIGGVMSAFQQQVDDARAIGEQEGRAAVKHELRDMVEKARNDGYRDAMGYLDDRVTTARDTGAREERARIANMSFFERRRYLRMHLA